MDHEDRTRRRAAHLLLAFLAGLVAADAAVADDPETRSPTGRLRGEEYRELEGRWQLVEARWAGPQHFAVDPRTVTYSFRGGEVTADYTASAEKAAYRVEAGHSPRRIDMPVNRAGHGGLGIYSREGDRLLVCFGTAGRPASFTPQGDDVLLVLERAKAK